jgi:C4-dicarboxylate-binding protein DctP
MNKAFFEKLSPAHQKLVLEVGHEQALFQRALAEKMSEEAGGKIKESGKIQYTDLTDEQRKAFRVASPPALKLVKERVSPEVVEIFSKTTGIK